MLNNNNCWMDWRKLTQVHLGHCSKVGFFTKSKQNSGLVLLGPLHWKEIWSRCHIVVDQIGMVHYTEFTVWLTSYKLT